MTGIFAAWPRKVLIAFVVFLGCAALFLFVTTAVKAAQVEASYYGGDFAGRSTANGEVFDPYAYTAAHKTYAFGTKLIVTYEGRSAVVRINDRGPFVAGRDLDLSQGAAEYLGLTAVGVGIVNVEVTTPDTPTGPYGGTKEVSRQALAGQSSEPVQDAQQTPAADVDQAGAAQPEGQQEDQQEGQRQEKARQGFAGIGQDQYASEGQYEDNASANQYKDEVVVKEAVPPAPPAPKPAVPVLPPEPEPAALEAPPVELAVPNSTIERRVELNVAAPPAQSEETAAVEETPEPVAEEPVAEEPVVEETPEPVAEEVPEPAAEEKPEPEKAEPEKAEPEKAEPEEAEPEEAEPEKAEATGPGGITVLPDTGGAPLGALFLAGGAMLLGAGMMVRIVRR